MFWVAYVIKFIYIVSCVNMFFIEHHNSKQKKEVLYNICKE